MSPPDRRAGCQAPYRERSGRRSRMSAVAPAAWCDRHAMQARGGEAQAARGRVRGGAHAFHFSVSSFAIRSRDALVDSVSLRSASRCSATSDTTAAA